MAVTFTEDQQKVIDLRNCNILVSAAAGSGKTAVLVERIVQMVSDPEHPVDIDRMLIVTFTNAAAAQMRERLSNVLAKKLEEQPDNRHLQRQLTLIHHALITTIDSFCLYLIRNHFQDIGLDPDFRVADEGEIRLLKQDVLSELLEEQFQEKRPEFLNLAESLSAGGREKKLEEMILGLYEFSMSYPWPEQWLMQHREDYVCEGTEELEQMEWTALLKAQVRRTAESCIGNADEALRICEEPDGPYLYAPALEADRALAEELLGEKSLEELYSKLNHLNFAKLSAKKDASIDPDKRELVKQMRGAGKDLLKELGEKYFYESPQQLAEDMHAAAPLCRELLDQVLRYMERFGAVKREKNLLDFHDMEHKALQILLEPGEDGAMKPTRTALEYREYFEEILIDEYQDSNLVQEYLLQSIAGEEDGKYNRFMVGDVKQSIYKFRLARPELFLEKFASYDLEKGVCRRVDLKQNFRSRSQVTESVNRVFYRIMGRELGGIEYDKDAALYPGAVYPEAGEAYGMETEDRRYRTEVLLATEEDLESNGEKRTEKLTEKQREALMIAGKIRELAGRFPVRDHANGEIRPARFGDIVILLRTTSGWDEEFRKILEEEGIPAYVTSRTGYFAATEVQNVLNFLRILNNPLQDIPFFGVLHSIIGDFSDREIAILRAVGSLKIREGGAVSEDAAGQENGTDAEDAQESAKRSFYLYDCLKYYASSGKDAGLQEKCAAFLKRLEHYRKTAVYLPIHKLLQQFFGDSRFLERITSLPGGQQRRMNVEMLLTRAEKYEQTSYTGLFHFVRYMEQMEKYEVDYGEASVLDENADTVRIMSIHKSKGLEFPICFVSGLAKSFNRQDIARTVIWDMDYGIGMDWIDPNRRVKAPTMKKGVLADKLWKDSLGEELRVLYVAMTRAEEKLYLTGFYKEKKKPMRAAAGRVPYAQLAAAGSYLDFLMPVFLGNPEEWEITWSGGCERLAASMREDAVRRNSLRKLQNIGIQETFDPKLERELEERFLMEYEHENLAGLYVKTTVSELKRAGMEEEPGEESVRLVEEEELVPYVPAFLRTEEKDVPGAIRGTAYHRVLERFPLLEKEDCRQWNQADVKRVLEQMAEQQFLSREACDLIHRNSLVQFLHSGLAERMRLAETKSKLHREQPFVLGIPANELQPEFPEEELVLIQGIIDVWFEEEDGLVAADYKTDYVRSPEELIRRYQGQLNYYARALEQLTGRKVKEKRIYSFALGEEILIP